MKMNITNTGISAISISIASLALASCGTDVSAPASETSEVEMAPAEETTAITANPGGTSATAEASARDPIRGAGGLEEECHTRVAEETGANVAGTNRIEESEAAIEIYVNVEGAQAPWKCLGYFDGTIAEVSFTGSEGAM